MSRRVGSIQEYFETLGERFIAPASKGVNATIVFDLAEGPDGGQWTVTVQNETCTVATGKIEKPTVTITMKPADYLAMANGDLDGTKAFLTRKLKVSGNIPMAQKMKAFLPPHSGK
jgi:putative sterol carrier protein